MPSWIWSSMQNQLSLVKQCQTCAAKVWSMHHSQPEQASFAMCLGAHTPKGHTNHRRADRRIRDQNRTLASNSASSGSIRPLRWWIRGSFVGSEASDHDTPAHGIKMNKGPVPSDSESFSAEIVALLHSSTMHNAAYTNHICINYT